MFINQIDEIINNIIDSVYKTKFDIVKVLKNKSLLDLIDKNIYNNINNILTNRYNSYIINVIEKLILYLIVLLSGINNNDFVNYVLNLSHNSPKLLNTENISKIVKLYNYFNDIKLKKNIDIIEGIDETFFNLKNKESTFNLIKILIIKTIYFEEDRSKILQLIEDKELENTESKYIEIIDSFDEEIDYNNLELLFNVDENKKEISEIFYHMILDYENNFLESELTIEEKINYLFEKKILIPITDEFLRYHKFNDKYENTNTKLDKIRQVVYNLNTISEYYSKKKENEKIYYQPLQYRKAILYNNVDEINSINKLVNIGLTAMRSNEFFQDLLIYRNYAYINYNNFKSYGFSFLPSKTIDAIRYCNFEFNNPNINNKLETRVITSNNRVNVVGIALPKYSIFNKNTIIQCTKIKNTFNLNKLHKNPYEEVLKKIKQLLLNNNNYGKIGYWIFNKKNDILISDTYNDINELTFEEFYRYIISSFYDILINITYDKIINVIEDFKTLHSCYFISNYIQNKFINLPINSEYYNILHQKIIKISKIKTNIDYDENEDKIPGINSELIKLPKYKDNTNKLIQLRITENNLLNNNNELLNDNAICQHIISWTNLSMYKKKNPNYFNQLLFEFKKKYITINLEGDFVCKSCYQSVDIKKYAFDWTAGTEEGISLSFTLESQLENLPEYEKYKTIIKYLDKYIEKIAISVHLPVYIGNLPQIKIRRQEIIKNIIDFIIIQNKTLRISDSNERKKRLEEASKIYGLNKDYTQFFIFELKNDIFIYSSKDTDKFKRSKINNIMIYAIMFIINEITLSQILFFIEDKTINIENFKKYYKTLFDNLNIYVNNSKELKPILNYPLLCYILYVFAGILIKYNLWYNPENIKNFDLKLYSFVIHTYIDLLNSILEVNTFKEKNYLYEIYATKFYIQLYKIFNDNKILSKVNKIQTISKKEKSNVILIPLTGEIIYPFFGYNKFYLRSSLNFLLKQNNQNIKINNDEIKDYFNNWYDNMLYKLFDYYKLDGTKRLINDVKEKNVNKNDLLKMIQNITIRRNNLSNITEEKRLEYNNYSNEKIKNNNENIKFFNKKYNINNYENIKTFIKKLEKITDLQLDINVFIIEHDISGNKLKKPIIINSDDKRIQFKRNDVKYGSNIYIYQENNNFYIYHGTTLNMIAYKNNIGKIVNNNLPLYLKINYSLQHQLLFLGYEKLHYSIKDMNKKKVIINLIRNRILNLKNILINIQKILYQINNKYDNINTNIIAKNYINKFKNINVSFDNEEINNIINNLFYISNNDELSIQDINDEIYIGNLIIINNNDSIILNFICNKLSKLLDNNSNDKYTLTNLGLMIIDLIKKEYNNYMKRNDSLNNIEVRKFIEIKYNNLIFNDIDTINVLYDENQNMDDENEGLDVDVDPDDAEEEQTFFRIDD